MRRAVVARWTHTQTDEQYLLRSLSGVEDNNNNYYYDHDCYSGAARIYYWVRHESGISFPTDYRGSGKRHKFPSRVFFMAKRIWCIFSVTETSGGKIIQYFIDDYSEHGPRAG